MLVTTSCMVPDAGRAVELSVPTDAVDDDPDLADLLSVCGLTAMVLLQLNRSPILSQLTGTEPGKLSWDSSFLASRCLLSRADSASVAFVDPASGVQLAGQAFAPEPEVIPMRDR